jgi:radical SAM protein with 4Fe4S-binding SPASM domain
MHSLTNGDVSFCANDCGHREHLGDVHKQGIREVNDSPRLQEIRELMGQERVDEIPPCKDCSFWKAWLQN